MIQRDFLQQGKSALLEQRYRVRLLKIGQVPIIFNHLSQLGEEVLVIDLPEAEGYETKVLGAQRECQALVAAEKSQSDDNKENCLPPGCKLEGDPLKLTFLSINKLDQLAAANKTRADDGFDITTSLTDRFGDLELHLIPQMEAHALVNKISGQKFFSEALESCSVAVFSEGSAFQQVVMFGIRRANDAIATFRARYMGPYNSASVDLNKLNVDGGMFPLRKMACRCQFDLLKDSVLIDKTAADGHRGGNFVPAAFLIEAEWTLTDGSKEKRTTGKKTSAPPQHLTMPPDTASVTVKFKPGWKDARIALTGRINELRYLAQLSEHLKGGTLPWHNSSDDQAEAIVERATKLVHSARDKLDAQPVYPFDFTDRLWDVLKTVKSVETLRRILELVFDQLRTGEFRVLVETSKVSSLAKMLRIRNPDDIIFQRLEPMICLQLLVEVGADRFSGELAHRFLSGHFLANALDLEPYLLRPQAPIELRIERLIPLHLALQSMIMIDDYVRLPQHEKANMAKRLLAHFTSMKGTEAFETEFVHHATMEDIHRNKLNETLSEWELVRLYEKCATHPESPGGTFSDVVHVAKNLGIKWIPPVDNSKAADEQEGEAAADESTLRDTTDSTQSGKSEAEYGGSANFDCVHLMISSQPSAIFA